MLIIHTTKGDIHIKLDHENTPKTAQNFLTYVEDKFYDNTIFHRVIHNFMVQGGGLTQDMQSKATKSPIQNEAKSAQPNKRGSIAMARTGDPHSATAQFFINLVDNHFLDFKQENAQGYGYCVFGHVVEGMDVVDAIAQVKTTHAMGHADVPEEVILITSISQES